MIYWDWDYREYKSVERIGRQTVELYLQCQNDDPLDDTLYFNIYLTLYSKRKHVDNNEDAAKVTGKDAIKTFLVVRRMFRDIVNKCLAEFQENYNIVIYCWWLDARRRDAYYRYLKTLGFDWGFYDGHKVIMKKFQRSKLNV